MVVEDASGSVGKKDQYGYTTVSRTVSLSMEDLWYMDTNSWKMHPNDIMGAQGGHYVYMPISKKLIFSNWNEDWLMIFWDIVYPDDSRTRPRDRARTGRGTYRSPFRGGSMLDLKWSSFASEEVPVIPGRASTVS
jgi:hypothetical protein